ncbi:MAG: cysteine peptidase family C39 domain-containing protein [archaeon]
MRSLRQLPKKSRALKKVPYFSQKTLYTCGPACARSVMAFFGKNKAPSEKRIATVAGTTLRAGTELAGLAKAISRLSGRKVSAKVFQRSEKNFIRALETSVRTGELAIVLLNRLAYDRKTPLLSRKTEWEDRTHSNHFVIVLSASNESVLISDPHKAVGRKKRIPTKTFLESVIRSGKGSGNLLVCKRA